MTPKNNYRWYIMILGALTNAFLAAMPTISLSVLLPEISTELHLNLVQAGLLWGMASLPMIFSSLLSGMLFDRFGLKRVLIAVCVLVGCTGALRGLSPNYAWLMISVFLMGFFSPLVTLGIFRNVVIWFPHREQGFANGLATLGMASGFFIGSMISATYLSPWLGGWRNVFILYGGIAVLFVIPWLFTLGSHGEPRISSTPSESASFIESILHLAKSRNVWLLTLANMAFNGGAQGLIGYLPLYLQGLGWPVSGAGGVLATYNIASMICVLPLTFWSDRPGSRRKILIGAALLSSLGIGLLSFVNGVAVWVAVMMAGAVRDAFIAITLAFVNGNCGIKKAYLGMTIGFVMFFMGIGNLAGPPLGNSFASLGAGVPMIFWAGLILSGVLCLALVRDHGPILVEYPVVETEVL